MKGQTEQLGESQAVLSYRQVERLVAVLQEETEVNGRGNFPTLTVSLRELIDEVARRISLEGLEVSAVKINGGVAGHIVAATPAPFNDIDLIFDVDLSAPHHFEVVRAAVLDALLGLLPAGTNKTKIGRQSLRDAYVRKLVKVDEGDQQRWSLISLNSDCGRSIELKFVDRMRRQFEFSVDSFQIQLDPLLEFLRARDTQRDTPPPLSRHCYPPVTVESLFGDFRTALAHLNDKLIDTRQPEEIRGGGLLKYCNLLVRGYRPAVPRRLRDMEKYMCSRFFIDFSDVRQQTHKLRAYLENHFRGDLQSKHEYLLLLHRIINESTICLMSHERRLTLAAVSEMRECVSLQMYYQNLSAIGTFGGPQRHSPALLYIPGGNGNGSGGGGQNRVWIPVM